MSFVQGLIVVLVAIAGAGVGSVLCSRRDPVCVVKDVFVLIFLDWIAYRLRVLNMVGQPLRRWAIRSYAERLGRY